MDESLQSLPHQEATGSSELSRLRSEVAELAAERRRLLEELNEARQWPSGSEVRSLFSLAAHELRTPVQSLLWNGEAISARLHKGLETIPAEWLKERLIRNQRYATRLAELVDNLLEAAQLEAGPVALQVEELDLVELLHALVGRQQEALEWAGSICTVVAPAALRGRWDRRRLDMILANLLSNAVKFGRGNPIEIRASVENGRARLELVDQGVGITAADLNRVFDRFVRTETGSQVSGVGVGLWIVRELVKVMGGTVCAESKPSAGSTFTVLLPLA